LFRRSGAVESCANFRKNQHLTKRCGNKRAFDAQDEVPETPAPEPRPLKRNATPDGEVGGVSTHIRSANDSSADSYKPRIINSATHIAHIYSRQAGRRYDVEFEGEILVRRSKDAECDLARTLLAKNIIGSVTVIDESGKPRTIVNIERAARLTVREDRRKATCFVPWKLMTKTARERVEGRAPRAERPVPKDRTGAERQRRYRSRHRRNGGEATVTEDRSSVTDESELPLLTAE
jgi:hypothetical protein